jgi:hypothetical protein
VTGRRICILECRQCGDNFTADCDDDDICYVCRAAWRR